MKEDIWLTKVMQTNCLNYSCNSIFDYLEVKKTIDLVEPYFITVKTKEAPEKNINFSDNQLKWICNMNSYVWNNNTSVSTQNNDNIFYYNEINFTAVSEIASNSFTTDRFHLDPRISKSCADKIKKEWIGGNLKGSRESINLVYKYPVDLKIVAFNSLLITDEFLIIDLIAVSNEYRGKGIGRELIKASQKLAAARNLPLIAGTLVENVANKLYAKSDFKIKEQTFVFHDTNQFFK
jgi:hypothetical protein